MSAITAAIRFLTVVPAPGGEWSARAASRSVAWFPAVGLGIGGAVAAVHWAARLAMPDLPAAALALAAGVVLTGALHLDGLADTFDGLLGGDTPKRRLEIMKDPSIGVLRRRRCGTCADRQVGWPVIVAGRLWLGCHRSCGDVGSFRGRGVDGDISLRAQSRTRDAVRRGQSRRIPGRGGVCGSPGVRSGRSVRAGGAGLRNGAASRSLPLPRGNSTAG